MAETYQCAMCGGTFETDRPDEESLAEMRALYGNLRMDELAIVCDDCFKKMDPANHPREVEEAVAEHIRERGGSS